ncbi:MAG: anti-sigma factor family protein, partial [Caulobacteraceae bacterium]
MSLVTDEALSAYLDGEADPETAARIEAALADDVGLRARLERMTLGGDALRDAVDIMLGAPSEELKAALLKAPSAEILPFAPKAKAAPPRHEWMRLAAASAAAMVIGAVGGGFLMEKQTGVVVDSGDGVVAGKVLASSLSTARSGVKAPMGGQVMTVALSFKASDGRLCRQFDLAGQDRTLDAVACRTGKDWRIEGMSAARPKVLDGFQTAGGPGDGP